MRADPFGEVERGRAGQVGARPQQALERLLRARPDLACPPPLHLAERVCSHASTSRAPRGPRRLDLCVARTMAARQGGDETPTAGLADSPGLTGRDDEIADAVTRLTELAPAWGEPPALTSATRAVLGPLPRSWSR